MKYFCVIENFVKNFGINCLTKYQYNLFRYVQDCRLDLLFSGNAGTASLHMKHLQEDCLNNIESRNGDEHNLVRKEEINNGNLRLPKSDARRGRGVVLSSIPETTRSSLLSISNIADSLCLNDCSGNGKCDSGNTYKF